MNDVKWKTGEWINLWINWKDMNWLQWDKVQSLTKFWPRAWEAQAHPSPLIVISWIKRPKFEMEIWNSSTRGVEQRVPGDLSKYFGPLKVGTEKNFFKVRNLFSLSNMCFVFLRLVKDIVKHYGGSIKKIVELWCLLCIMMFRRVNKQPKTQKFWN